MVKVKTIDGSSLFTVPLPQNELKPTPILKTDFSLKNKQTENKQQTSKKKQKVI